MLRTAVRASGALLVAAGVLTVVWVVVVWRWQDPFTALYTHVEQRHLAQSYNRRLATFTPVLGNGRGLAAVRRSVAAEAAAYRRGLRPGEPVGWIEIPRIGLRMMVVQGTDASSLEKGPGHYSASALPGQGRLVYVAGHRTTYLAPFAHIDRIRAGDRITLQLPYGAFVYRVVRHYVVAHDDLAVLRDQGRELLRLQACHPRFFATHRYIVDAVPVSMTPAGAATYALAGDVTPAST